MIHDTGKPCPDETAARLKAAGKALLQVVGHVVGQMLDAAFSSPGGALPEGAGGFGAAEELRATAAADRVIFKAAHGARHLEGTGLTSGQVEDAIRTQIGGQVKDATATGEFRGRVTVDGTTLEYRAYTLPSGEINVGTYYQPKKP